MNQQQVIKTKQNNEKLEHEGALYVFHKFSNDGLKKFWRCEFHGPADQCKGRLHTDLNNVMQKTVGVHSCDMSAARVECQRLVTGLKRRAAETCEAPATIRAQVLQSTCTPVLASFPSKDATKKVIKRLRRDENAPRAEPLNLEQLEIPNVYRIYKRTEIDEEQFLLADTGVFQIQGQNGPQRILIFGRASTADWTHEMKDIYADGTFALTPPLFSQIYVLLAKRDGWVFPICYCLLTSKCTAIYTRMLQLLLERWPNFAPQTISLDFELAMVGAVRTVLPACSVRYCFFHLVRNMKKQIRALGLTRVYNTDPIFAEKSKTHLERIHSIFHPSTINSEHSYAATPLQFGISSPAISTLTWPTTESPREQRVQYSLSPLSTSTSPSVEKLRWRENVLVRTRSMFKGQTQELADECFRHSATILDLHRGAVHPSTVFAPISSNWFFCSSVRSNASSLCLCTAPICRPILGHSMLFPPFVLLLAPIPLAFSLWPIVLAEPVFALDHLSLQNRATEEKQSSASTTSSLLSSVALTKCQSDYLSALIHRCMIRGAPTAMEGRICFADEVQLADVHKLVNYISEMCCLLRCQAKTLERLCCRHAQQQGRCRKANCLPIRDQKVLWEEAH
ncbi:hypothetical protein niasHT_028169 [Heterodera trifolii]|uniref:MULE transposase domain-containing protein n=1 Tax=Heterodera trifolii TaxID=157864 RepID=A0ABD2JNV2_9BILA